MVSQGRKVPVRVMPTAAARQEPHGEAGGTPAAAQGEQQPLRVWCPRCREAHALVMFQASVVLGPAQVQALLVLAQCERCKVALWPIATLPLAQDQQRPGGIMVPRGMGFP